MLEGTSVDLTKWPTRVKELYTSKSQYKKRLNEHTEDLSEIQRLLYASNRYALLLIFQAMDAAGKDGAIRHVMSGVNPQGCQVFSFKHSSATELDHDFLWRTTRSLPERGRIGIFDRSYYEEVLIVRVHPEILLTRGCRTSCLKKRPFGKSDTVPSWAWRAISTEWNADHKIFLHLSEEEQRQRFLQRIDEPEKNWKFSLADIEERKYWKEYMQAYEACLSATSTETAPWYIVPADDKKNARLIISHVILETLKSLNMSYPTTTKARLKELQSIRKRLAK